MTPARQGFLRHVQELCRRHEALLVFDEIQCGMGRTGKFFGYEWEPGVEPDVVTMAKALGGGLPFGALLVGARAAEALSVGSHGSTFGGNPVAAAAARVAVRLARSPEVLANVCAPRRCVSPVLQSDQRRPRPVRGRAGQGAHDRRGARGGARRQGGGARGRLRGGGRHRAERGPRACCASFLRSTSATRTCATRPSGWTARSGAFRRPPARVARRPRRPGA